MIQRTFRGISENPRRRRFRTTGSAIERGSSRAEEAERFLHMGGPADSWTPTFFASLKPGSASEWWHGSILFRIPDELTQSLGSGLLPLRAHHPPDGRLSIRRRLFLEEPPCLLVRPEPSLGDRVEFSGLLLLVRIDGGLPRISRLEGLETRGPHEPASGQFLDAFEVHGTPDAARVPRREADRVADPVDAPPLPVDPTETERLVHGLRPRNARLPRGHFIEPDP